MVQVYFHCSNTEGTLIDRSGTAVASLTEASPVGSDWDRKSSHRGLRFSPR